MTPTAAAARVSLDKASAKSGNVEAILGSHLERNLARFYSRFRLALRRAQELLQVAVAIYGSCEINPAACRMVRAAWPDVVE